MIYPKINFTKRGMAYQWQSTKTGFRYGGNSFWRWLKYPFTRAAWKERSSRRAFRKRFGTKKWPETHKEMREVLIAEDVCPECGCELDTGWECISCGFDAQPEANQIDIDKHHRDSRVG